MDSNYYQLYINKVLQLSETIVIKSIDTAEALNAYVDLQYVTTGVGELTNTLDPATWKYYLNLAGEYHLTDVQMQVVSMDTLENIIFSKENLLIHKATARGYAYGTRAYNELVTRFPDQEMLILGILYPVDIDLAIAAPDGVILGYPPDLIESNEYSLVSKLQAWIDGFKARYMNRQFTLTDNLYAASVLGVMYLQLVPTILNLRLEACKTNEAHSYHIRQYLASHGLLNAYVDQMTTKQALFFYRNITYIERNAGKRDIFDWLVEHIMTERFIPIAEYTMRHDLTNQPEDIYPTLSFRKKPLNLGYIAENSDVLSLERLLTKQDNLARDNLRYKEEVVASIQEQMENSLSNVVMTKVLESSMIDYSNSSPYSMEDILLNHWLFLSTEDIYVAIVNVANPKTGETLPLTAKEAYALMWYAFCKTVGIDLVNIPEVFAKRVLRIPQVDVDEIMSVVNADLVDRSIAEQALSMQPVITEIISTASFYDTCKEIYNAAQMQRRLKAAQHHTVQRGMVHGMISRIYSDNFCKLTEEPETYSDWLSTRNIVIGDLSDADLKVLYLDLIQEATGLALNTTTSLRDLQSAMVKMLRQLSSYSVQVIAEINNTEIKQTDWTAVRIGDQDGTYRAQLYLPDLTVQPLSRDMTYYHEATIRLIDSHIEGSLDSFQKAKGALRLIVKPQSGRYDEIRFVRVPISSLQVRSAVPLATNTENIIPVIGYEVFLGLTEPERQEFVDVYHNGYRLAPNYTNPEVDQEEYEESLYMVPFYSAPNYSF